MRAAFLRGSNVSNLCPLYRACMGDVRLYFHAALQEPCAKRIVVHLHRLQIRQTSIGSQYSTHM
eukprot:924492-Amphidinium_carterae.2